MARVEADVYHIPVMLQECLEALQINPEGTYVDATLGGGGHTSAILERLGAGGRLISFDADEVAIAHCEKRFAEELSKGSTSRLRLVHANFSTISEHLPRGTVNGVLLDLGVSSFQFDHHERGFSFRLHAPLDMRFMAEGETAADILNKRSEESLSTLFFTYGDEPQSRRLAKAVVQRRAIAPFRTTIDLRDLVVQHIPPHHQAKTLARLFQALRIAVNDELGRLERTLSDIIPLLAPRGRIVVMSYHSGEDRIVKNVFRANPDTLSIVTKKSVEASQDEQQSNPRSRSARLRVAQRKAE